MIQRSKEDHPRLTEQEQEALGEHEKLESQCDWSSLTKETVDKS